MMPNDAKLGLIIGVGLVIAVAVVFFRKDPASGPHSISETTITTSAVSPSPHVPGGGMYRPAEAKNPTRNDHSVVSTQRHTVQEGDTLFSLAQRYYGDKDKFIQIYQVNREILKSADILTPGTVLTIPDVPNSSLEVKVESGS